MKSCPLGGGRDQEIEVTLWKAASELLFHWLEPTMATRTLGSVLDHHFPVNPGIKTLLKNLTFSCPLSPKSSKIGQIQHSQGDTPRFPGIFQVPVCCGGN